MDAKKFGLFIAALRKEKGMTQADLAGKLQVTDKAVSRWERGLGFPDINSIEPLADALGVSVLELMRSERVEECGITQDAAAAALTDTIELVKLQRRAERRSIVIIAGSTAAILCTVFLIDNLGWLLFMMDCFPTACLVGGLALGIYGIWRKKNGLPCLQTFLLAALMLLVPAGIAMFLIGAGALGLGPVPT